MVNVKRVFVHDVTSCGRVEILKQVIPAIAGYDERALLMAGADDVVCVLQRPEKSYLRFLAELGVGPEPENIIAANEMERSIEGCALSEILCRPQALGVLCRRLEAAEAVCLSPFIATAREFTLAAALAETIGRQVEVLGGCARTVERANQKHHVREKAVALGIRVAPGKIVELELGSDGRPVDLDVLRVAIEQQRDWTGRVIVRGSRGQSASATFVVEANAESLRATLKKLEGRSDNRYYLVEAMMPFSISPNVQINVDACNGRISCTGVTDQVLDAQLVHRGNMSPSRARTSERMIADAVQLATWMRDEGFTGPAGFDFCEIKDSASGKATPMLAELNARVNGATYPVMLSKRLGGSTAFVARTVKTSACSFGELRRRVADLLFEPGGSTGVVPYNLACLRYGTVSLAAFAPARTEAEELFWRTENKIQ
jgi:hypothetical protein